MMNKKEWLDVLYYDIGKQQYDFRVSGLWKDKEGNPQSTKWIKYSQLIFPLEPWEIIAIAHINNREILPNELVIDLEDKNLITKVINKLKEWGLTYYIFETHSRGYHIHLFFKDKLNEEKRLRFIEYFKGDIQKAYISSPIALEYAKHWKSGKIKTLIKKGDLWNLT